MVKRGMSKINILGKAASAIGVALDLRDITGLVRNGFAAAGGATVIGGLVKEVASLSSPTSIAVGLGSLLILLSVMPSLVRMWPFNRKQRQSERSHRDNTDLKLDALDHFMIEGVSRTSLTVLEGLAGKPIMYPLVLQNTRPLPIDIVGYDMTILWDDKPAVTVNWHPPSATTSSGFRVVPPYTATNQEDLIRIGGDSRIELGIPVNLRQIGTLPTLSPRWGIKGYLSLICAGIPSTPKTKTFDLATDHYQIDQISWGQLKSDIEIG